MTLYHRALLALALMGVLALTACDAAVEGPGPPPAPSDTTIRFDFNYIEAINDCDSVGAGDFTFRVTADPSFSTSRIVVNRGSELRNGERTGALGREEFTTTATHGQEVTIEFFAFETDFDILGRPFNDARLDRVERTQSHSFDGQTWSSLGPRTLSLGSGNCRVRLSYTATEV